MSKTLAGHCAGKCFFAVKKQFRDWQADYVNAIYQLYSLRNFTKSTYFMAYSEVINVIDGGLSLCLVK